jgi:hypothetical protein
VPSGLSAKRGRADRRFFQRDPSKNFPLGMAPARGLESGAGFRAAPIKLGIAGIGVSLRDAGPAGEMSCGMLAATVERAGKRGSGA